MKLILTLKNDNPHYIVKMCGDYNDGDYSYSEERYEEESFKKVVKLLYDINKLVNVEYGGKGYDMVEDAICDLCSEHGVSVDYPSGDTASGDCGIHTLYSLDITFIDSDGYIYDVEMEE